jgi:hypothetical protein
MPVPYTFGTATTSIPLSNLDANFNTPITLGNTTVGLGNTVTTVGNLTLTNVNITSGTINSAVVVESYALANAVVYSDAVKDGTTSANLTFNGTTFAAVNDATISGLTVGKGGGAVSTNTAVGASALIGANSGDGENSAIGYQALYTNTTGRYNTATGSRSLYSNTTGERNSAVGMYALYTNTTGSYNTAQGMYALYLNTTASNNTAVGYQAGYTNTTGASSTYMGYQAGYTNNANGNVFVGYTAGRSSTAVGNTFVGYEAGYNSTGTINTFVGYDAGVSMTTGAKNTIIGGYSGNQGGLDIRTASNYIVLSDGDGNPRFFFNGAIGYLNTVTRRNSGMLSIDYAGTSAGGMGINDTESSNASAFIGFLTGGTFRGSISNNNNSAVAYNTTSDYRLKENIAPMTDALAKVSQLKPCTYTWKETGNISQGFIAHELAEVCPDAVTGEKDAVDADGNPKYQGVDTSFLVATLTAAIQELKAEVDSLKAQLNK